MRGREFIMKDGYSFDCDELGAERTYEAMYKAYEKIFSRCGLTFRVVEAESGLIGGTSSHEFMVSSDSGEDVIVSCSECEYAANLERAECGVKKRKEEEEEKNLELIHTPRAKTVEEVCKFLGVKAEKLIKTLLYETEKGLIACLILGNQEVNETKLRRALDCKRLSLADSATIKRLTKAEVGFTGPIGLEVLKIADRSLKSCRNFVVGGNKTDTHYINANIGRDFSVDRYADIRVARDGDPCPRCEGVLKIKRGIEVGHLFNLGTKYSEAMNAKFLDEKGEEKLIIMGCFGIGVSRVMAAVIEQHHDSKGIIWPPSIAPFEVIVLPVNVKDEGQFGAAVEIYKILQNKGVEVLLDDRDESPGKKFNDSDLIGIPIRITVGKKFRETGKFEISLRRTFEKFYETKEEVFKKVRELISKEQGE
jgi:prolyl-tRNA synthetase